MKSSALASDEPHLLHVSCYCPYGPCPRLKGVVRHGRAKHSSLVHFPPVHMVGRGPHAYSRLKEPTGSCVHADLSSYNMLVLGGQPWFIDFSEAIRVDRTGSVPWMRLEEARVALERGMGALRVYFGRLGVEVEPEPFVSRVLSSLDRFGVLRV